MNITHNFPFCEPDFATCKASQVDCKTLIRAPRLYSSLAHWRVFGGGGRTGEVTTCHSYHIARFSKCGDYV